MAEEVRAEPREETVHVVTQGIPGHTGSKDPPVHPVRKENVASRGIQVPGVFPGAKGEPGESISIPTVAISPKVLTVRENQNAEFQCSSTGNPSPTITWLLSDSSGWKNRARLKPDGRLVVHRVTLADAGEYTCTGTNLLGKVNQSAALIVEGKLFVLVVISLKC